MPKSLLPVFGDSQLSCHRFVKRVALATVLLTLPSSGAAEDVIFTQTEYEDFAAGGFGNAGHNLFAARDGTIRFVNWFDLNADGHPDIVINNDHNPYENVDAMIHYNRGGRGLRSLLPPIPEDTPAYQRFQWERESLESIDFLPTLGGGRSVIEDLNGDGYPDIAFTNFIHGWAKDHFPVFIYWGSSSGYSISHRSELPSLEARSLVAADLSGNGRLDLVLANYGMEYHASDDFHGDQYESWIYWQDDRGFSEQNRLALPTEYAIDVEAADLDGDSLQDLVFLNAGPRPAVRIFTRGADGYDATSFTDLPVLNAKFARGLTNRVLVSDLNGNGRSDIFVTSEGDTSEIFWNGPDGFSVANRTEIETSGAIAAAASDLDGNGFADLVIANNHRQMGKERDYAVNSYIYWGGTDGFSAERRTELPTLGAAGVEIGDVTGDGFVDIVFANYRDNEVYEVPSYIYTGSETGYHPAARGELYGFGPVDVKLADLTGNGRLDVFLMNRHSGKAYGAGIVPSYVYWGNEAGAYSNAAMSRLAIKSGYSSNAGDLNGNGHADLVFTTRESLTILYGRDGNFPADGIHVIPMPFRGMTTNLADLDRDGFLDILVGGLGGSGEESLAILFGGPDGFGEPEFFDVGLGIIASAVGDLSGDGRLEIILGGRGDLRVIPLTEEGTPDTGNAYWLRMDRQTQRIALADLNDDGSLDLVASHYRDNITKRLTVSSAIYWNKNGRLAVGDRTDLQTYGGHWISVADIGGTGELDLLFSNYHGEKMRAVDLFIYHPDSDGNYGGRRTTVPAVSSSANLVMDFTGDGYNDLLVVNHTGPNQYVGLHPKSGVHGHGSFLYSGGDDGFDVRRRTVLPSFGPHKIINAEPGDIARRRPYETYTSALLPTELDDGNYVLEVTARQNFRTSVDAFYRTDMDGTWVEAKPLPEENRFRVKLGSNTTEFQYKLHLNAGGSGTGPVVESVQLLR